LTHAKNVLDQLKTDIANLADYRITQANITELEASITEAENSSSQPTVKRKLGVVANKANRTLIRTIDANLDSIENLIVGEYEETEKTFVNLFLSARYITNLGSRSTKLIVTVVDKDGKPVADAYGDVLEMDNEEQYSDENGELTIIGIKNGTYTLEVSLGEAKTSVKFTIKLGEQLKLKVVL
jgi:protocatechuate 3,4-dioxygenase beta subunit